MNEIINWCNNNQGFISFILSTFTIIISIIAICVSIRTSLLPYRKKIRIFYNINYLISNNSISEVPDSITLLVINNGNVTVGIRTLTISYKTNNIFSYLTNNYSDILSPTTIEPSHKVEATINFVSLYIFLNEQLCQGTINIHQYLYIEAIDYENKIYRKKFITIEKFLNYYAK